MTFDKPQWKWSKVYEEMDFGGMRNTVRVEPLRKKAYNALVAIPTDFFKFAREVLKIDDLSGAWFYMEETGNGKWTFGVEYGNDFMDLWSYTDKSFPVWLNK